MNATRLYKILAKLPPATLQAVALLGASATIEQVSDAMQELIAYQRACQQTAETLANLPAVPLTVVDGTWAL